MKRVKIVFTALILLCAITISVNAQQRTLEGVVTDDDGKFIADVEVKVKGTDLFTKTDGNGRYVLKEVPGSALTLLLSHTDMKQASATIGIYDKIDIVMSRHGTEGFVELSLEDLLNMDVTTASKSAEKQSDAPGIISVLTNDELERFGGTTLKDVLERIPGIITGTANYTNRTLINVRGDQIKDNSSHVLILINGRPAREVQEGGVSSDILETFPVNIIERIEVVKGPGSVLYGSDAFSGVINIITKQAEKFSVSVTGLSENGDGYGTNGNVRFKVGDLSVVISGRYLKKANWETPYSTIPFMSLADTTVMLDIPDEGFGGYVGIQYKGLSLMSTYNQWTKGYISGTAIANNKLDKNFNNLGYNFDVSDNWNTDINLTYTKSNLDGENLSRRSSYNMVAELTNSIHLSEKSKMILGGLYNKNHGEENIASSTTDNRTVISEGNTNSLALYTQVDYHLLEHLKLIGGIQAIKVENIDLAILPRGGVIWYPIERLSIKGLYSQAFRAPGINETSINYLDFFIGNKDLKPEKVSTFDIGVGYQGTHAQAGISFFQSKMTDIISSVSAGGVTQYQNANDVTFTGVEFEGKYYINKSIFVQGSMLYQTNKDSIKNVSPVANISTKAGISYKSDNGITIGLFDIYQGDVDDRFIDDLNPDQGAYNLLHLHTNFNFNKLFNLTFKPEISLFFDIDNLLDKPHYAYSSGTGGAIPFIPGRTVYFGIKVSLE